MMNEPRPFKYSASTLRALEALKRGPDAVPAAPNLDKLREAWIDHWAREARRARKWARFEMCGPHYPRPLPKRLCGLTCGAKLRDGTRCPCVDISRRNGRCHAHGGASTGPKSPEGKARCATNSGLPRMWAQIRAEVARMER